MKKEDFTLDEKIKLVKGMGSWHTNDLEGKIKSIHLSDGPHGLRAQSEKAKSNNDSIVANCFPTACSSACSFNRDLIKEMAGAIADEAKSAGVSVLLGPGVNMKRSPLCGRNFEYFSEDPYLAGEIATAYVNGVQEKGIATSLKHFAANSQETHRMTSNSMIDERALLEIYLRAFEKVVKNASPATIMASYNLVNGKPACENKWLLADILRKEWGYKGLVMSDWGACVDAGACIEAGMDLEMPDSCGNHKEDIITALNDGKLTSEGLDRAVSNVCSLVEEYSQKDSAGLRDIKEEMLKENNALAVKVSLNSAVLLKNEDVLPLNEPKKVIVIGSLAENMRVQGGGSSHIKTQKLTNIIEAFTTSSVEVEYYKGYDCDAKNIESISDSDKKLSEEAILGIKNSLKNNKELPIIICGGLTDKSEGEGYDRESMLLPYNQRILYKQINELTDNVIFVSFGGSPYDMSDIMYAKAILCMYLSGEGVARAAADIILGKYNPSGRLAETWPLSIEDTPCYKNFGRNNERIDDVMYAESLFIGYRYYDSFNVPVRFPFGYGLSYSSFEYSNLKIYKENGETKVSVDVKNTGKMAGEETVLIFVKNPNGDFIRANRELRGFDKVSLNPNESSTVDIILDERSFEIYDIKTQSYIEVPGEYLIEVSKSVGDVILSEKIAVSSRVGIDTKVSGLLSQREKLRSYFPDSEVKERFDENEFRILYGKELSSLSDTKPGEFSAKNSLKQMAPYSKKARFLLKFGKIVTRFMTGSPLDDPESMMIYEGISEGNIDSLCNQSGGIISHKMIMKVIKQANKGAKNG